LRIFFGATIPEITKLQIKEVQREFRELTEVQNLPDLDIRFESEDKLHITLQFIGDFESSKVQGLFSSIGAEIEKSLISFSEVEVSGLDFFPGWKTRRGVWLECKDDGTLGRISGIIKSVTKRFGVASEERPFKAHITIARMKGRDASRIDLNRVKVRSKLKIDKFFPTSVALFESTLKTSGSEYRILSRISLSVG
jgi:2'-5' RNA ligase